MSRLTGKCDLYDHIFMIGSKGTMKDMSMVEKFEVFKKRTGGVIYTKFPLELNSVNINNEIELVNNPDILSRNADGTYTYYYTNYKTLKQLNKHGYYATKEIHFDDILDIFPYLTHIISMSSSDPYRETVYITYEDYNTQKEEEFRLFGSNYNTDLFKKSVKEELIKIVKEYY